MDLTASRRYKLLVVISDPYPVATRTLASAAHLGLVRRH
jgi:hypothetical protein